MALLYEDLSCKIRSCAIEVRKNYGPGHKETVYQKAFAEELIANKINFRGEEPIDIFSPKTGKKVGSYRPDFIAEDKILIELKAANLVPQTAVDQLYTHLRNSEFEFGFLINFGGKKMSIKRVICSNDRKAWFKRVDCPCKSVSSSAFISVIKGRVYKFGDNVNTDDIYPGKYLSITTDREEMARHCFETVYPDFLKSAKPGEIIVAGRNFGCGSSREQAATCLRYFGVSIIVAESFARIFYRNAINLGLPILIAPGVSKTVQHGDIIEVNLEQGEIDVPARDLKIQAIRLPSFVMDILHDGGLIPSLKKRLHGFDPNKERQ